MAACEDVDQRLGAHWVITVTCKDLAGAVLNLADGAGPADVQFRLASETGVVMDRVVGDGVTITDAPNGVAIIAVTPDMQIAAGVEVRPYHYEVRAILGDGTKSDQLYGTFEVHDSLFTTFPFP